ncbi:sarcosine oxidase subunit delta [Pseudooceanicola sp.]|uniref:sarcosine oxidase subunit delta n=1 Tax=Pseudooceanicola sp. TaxID=1914328 RepID=UPI00261EA15D|nr:sarcosine oxidase subunit delta [Pseudooceanicola sp.]MDF1853834.1 sarcosine oxidase subunit delta [Pseudooceanicola sp.]
MRINCPTCGERDRREFYYGGAALARPAEDAGPQAWDAYLHLRDNPAGRAREWWFHESGCSAWLLVERNSVTHEVYGVALADGGRS